MKIEKFASKIQIIRRAEKKAKSKKNQTNKSISTGGLPCLPLLTINIHSSHTTQEIFNNSMLTESM